MVPGRRVGLIAGLSESTVKVLNPQLLHLSTNPRLLMLKFFVGLLWYKFEKSHWQVLGDMVRLISCQLELLHIITLSVGTYLPSRPLPIWETSRFPESISKLT